MAQQEEPLYDFPEPSQSERKFLGHQRGQGSLRSISVLDRLLLTVPVWLQLSINPATALHILQREPPGTFLVRKSRTSHRNVLCVRLADDSVPSFVHQFGIREEHCTLSVETSAISFPDLPRLISFYCVSRDVLPFPLELPEAIAKATSHKELESISHMGIEFWSSHLNVRGPREAPKPQKDTEKKPDTVTSASTAAPPQTSSESTPQPNSDYQLNTVLQSDTTTKQSGPNPTLFHEFCPITTRSPRELDCGSGLGALCFINPLFLQSQNALSRRRMFKRSLKVRVSTETSTMLSPPLAPPPPPPLMPKTKGRCKAPKQEQEDAQPSEGPGLLKGENLSQVPQSDPTAQDTKPPTQIQDTPSEAQMQPPSTIPHSQPETQEQGRTPGQTQAGVEGVGATAQLPAVMENLPDDSDYMQPSPMINFSHSPSLSPYLSPAVSPMAPPLFPKMSLSLSLHSSPCVSPSLSPYQSPSLSPKVPFSISPHDSPSASPSLSPYQSPSPSPKIPFGLSLFTSAPFSQLAEQAHHTPATPSRPDQQRSERDSELEGAGAGENKDEDGDTNEELQEKGLVLQMNAASLNDTDSCSSFGSLEGAAETPPHSPHSQNNTMSL
ncbi:ras and Rab interactor 2-like [Xiphias gladius]|uniref:ras and Rab interactor 2-like n=1 Tax=Xiphias gladius TaxID=8245 RepID=UPI001A97F52F|nr:ras and Rab interactor 2-like [Xiphias gladius]XP_040006135.1 ras and Rab interactor 2-like [Xiphias gladius]XP_040006136.1 ras and Rab interactor 2-like [Xiphias gladius]XP_040006138.1 ras and Rab interactor 2-like [Xiphias gladius]